MNNRESITETIRQINTGQKFPALKLVSESPQTAAIVSKLIEPQDKGQFTPAKPETQHALNQAQIHAISESTKQRVRDNENTIQLFPDIELAIQIVVSCVLSPKDMVKNEIIYKAKEPILPAELLLKLNTVAKTHLESYHGIQEEMATILREALFKTGSYIKAVIPESIVDEIINKNKSISTESLVDIFESIPEKEGDKFKVRSLGILGNSGKPKTGSASIAMESFFRGRNSSLIEANIAFEGVTDSHLEVSDNFQLLKLPEVVAKMNQQTIKSIVKRTQQISLESVKDKKLTTFEMSKLTYKQNSPGSQTFIAIPSSVNSKRKSVGRPLSIKLPSESVIPVYIPGNESKHIGYFIVIDGEGNPVSRSSVDSMTSEGLAGLQNNQSANQSLSASLMAKARKNIGNVDAVPTIDQITKVYASIVENDLMERLSNGIYGNNLQIGASEEIYRIMLSRSLASKFTRLLYLPAEFATYFAFNYFPNGIGKSYLDDIKNLTSLRAILLFSKIMAQVKSAINITHVGMTLDPRDPDPQKTIELAQQEVVKMRQQYFPLGINSPIDLVDWIQRAGLEFSFEGHPSLPQTKFDFESKTMQRDVPDSDLDEALRKQTYMAFGLSPETVDNGFNSEFATTVVQNNILLSKRVTQLQKTFSPLLSSYGKSLLLHDSIAMEEFKELLKDNIGMLEKTLSDEEKAAYTENKETFIDDLIERYLENLQLDLPHPDVSSIETQSSAFSNYSDSLDKVLDSWISANFMTSDLVGEISSNIDSIKEVVKAYFLRRWMSENGYMPELNDIVTADEDGKPTLDIYDINKNHMEGLIRSCLNFIKSMKPPAEASNKDIETLGVPEGSSSGSSYDSSSSSGGDDGLGGGFDDMSFDIPPDAGTGDAGDAGTSGEPEPEEPKSDDETPKDDTAPAE